MLPKPKKVKGPAPSSKLCPMCKQEKLLDKFFEDPKGKWGRSSRCRECDGVYQKKYRANKVRSIPEGVESKVCSNCKKELPLTDFTHHRHCKWGLNPWCKECSVNRNRESVLKNHKKYLIYQTAYHKSDRGKKIRKRYQKMKIKTDPVFVLKERIRQRILRLLTSKCKSAKTQDLLGLSFSDFFVYLKSLFWPGMVSENYGKKGWHIDHIRPLDSYNLLDPAQQKDAFHHTNIQPLWWDDNLIKHNRLDWSPLESQHELPERFKRETKGYWKVIF